VVRDMEMLRLPLPLDVKPGASASRRIEFHAAANLLERFCRLWESISPPSNSNVFTLAHVFQLLLSPSVTRPITRDFMVDAERAARAEGTSVFC